MENESKIENESKMENESKLLKISFDALADEDDPLGGASIYFYVGAEFDLTYEKIVSDLHKMKDAGLSLIEMYQAVKALSPYENQEYWELPDIDRVDILVGGDEDEPEGIWFEFD